MSWRKPGNPRRISKVLWWVQFRVAAISNALGALGSYLSFGPRPRRPIDTDADFEACLAFQSPDETSAIEGRR